MRGTRRVQAANGLWWAAQVGAALLISGCGGGGGGTAAPAPAPDLAGIWAGVWEGVDPVLGRVGGTWEAAFTQTSNQLTGPVTLLGDVDCMSGAATGAIDAGGQLSGALDRSPCPLNEWTLTALDAAALTGTGTWTQPQSGARGSLSGQRVATLSGPRIISVYPPAGAPGTVVTIAGTSLESPAAASPLAFEQIPQPTLISANAARWVARVPINAPTGSVQVRTAAGSATGPVTFGTDVVSPSPLPSWSLPMAALPTALTFSRDGRKLFVAERRGASGAVTVVHTLTQRQLTSTAVTNGAPTAIATSPDGTRLYVAAAGAGVLVMDAAVANLLGTIALPVNDGGYDNPQGIATSPDGALLLVSDGVTDGAASLVRTADRTVLQRLAVPAGHVPLGVAFSRDGEIAYVLAADAAGGPGSVLRFRTGSGALLGAIAVGARPTGIATSPDDATVFVSNQADHTVSRIDVANAAVTATVPAGLAPSGLSVSPDGSRVFVANRDGNTVSVLSAATGLTAAPAVAMAGGPRAVAIDSQGRSAFVALGTSGSIAEIGGERTLNVVRSGTGYGKVTSSPAGIACGTACLARFAAGTVVTLSAEPDSGSRFVGWSGENVACTNGVVTLIANGTCVARFDSLSAPPTNPPASGCFIATAAYGSSMAPEVQSLREFRDRHLMTNAPGRALVTFYYRHSPSIANAIRTNDIARAGVRTFLWPAVFAVRQPAVTAALILASCAGLGLLWSRGASGAGWMVRRRGTKA
jgi:YVTN family beta-propeller protein